MPVVRDIEIEEHSFVKKLCLDSEKLNLRKSKEISPVGELELFSLVSKSINREMTYSADNNSNAFDNDNDIVIIENASPISSLSKIMKHVTHYKDKQKNTYSRTNNSSFYDS